MDHSPDFDAEFKRLNGHLPDWAASLMHRAMEPSSKWVRVQGLGAFLAELFIERRSALEHMSGRQAQFGELADIHGYFWESAA